MLLHSLLLIGSLSLSAAQSLPRLDTVEQTKILAPTAHEAILPVAECAFSEDSQCSQDRDSYLTIAFSAENNTLFANQGAIFPAPLPMEFSAIRHSGSGQDDQVRLSYALEARPIPREPRAPLGELYLLKLKLLDESGRLASDYVVMVGLTASGGSDSLAITEVNTAPLVHPHHDHHSPHHHPDTEDTTESWLRGTIHALKSTAKECIHLLTHPPPPPPHHHRLEQPSNDDTLPSTPNSTPEKDPHRTVTPAGTHTHHGHRSHPYWHGSHRNFGRLVRPVILPALLGAATGVLACVMGFVLGRVLVMVYYCVRGQGRRAERRRLVRVPVVMVQSADVEAGEMGEKERLLREVEVDGRDCAR